MQLHDSRPNDAAIPDLFDRMARDPKSIVARFLPVFGQDYFVNFWLLQMGAEDLSDPIRLHAYYLDSALAPSICAAIVDWQGDVTVWTRDPKLEKELARTCDTSPRLPRRGAPPLPAG